MIGVLRSFDNALWTATKWTVILVFSAMIAVIWASVVFRYLINDPLSWADQLAKYLMVWGSFLAAGAGVRRGAHVGIDLFVGSLKGRKRRFLAVFTYVAGACFLLVVAYQGALFTDKVSNQHDPLVFEISMAIPYASMPVGFFLMFVQLTLSHLLPAKERWQEVEEQNPLIEDA